jgi:hypothetical protein
MGRRARGRWKCDCALCTTVIRDKVNAQFEAKLVEQELKPDTEVIHDSWHDWDKEYDI